MSTSLCLISLFVGAVCVVVWRGSESWISIGVGGSVGWISIGGGDVACSICSCLHGTGPVLGPFGSGTVSGGWSNSNSSNQRL